MTKAELIKAIHKKCGQELTKKKVEELVDAVFGEIGKDLVRKKITKNNGAPSFAHPGFGTFKKRRKKAREGRNPGTGEPIRIPARTTVSFSPGTELKRRLNK